MYLDRTFKSQRLQEGERNKLIDVGLCGEVCGITANIDGILGLVNSYPIDLHRGGKRQMLEINGSKVLRHSQVDDYILCDALAYYGATFMYMNAHHWLLRDGASGYLHCGICAHAVRHNCPSCFCVCYPGNVLHGVTLNKYT